MANFLADARLAIRMLLKSPVFTMVLVGTLALGIGASCAIFSVVNTVLLRPLPYQAPDRLMRVFESSLKSGERTRVSPGNFADWREQNRVFEQIAAFEERELSIVGGAEPDLLRGVAVSPELPRLLGVTPILGRTFSEDEGRAGGARVALVGESYWQSALGGDPRAVGRILTVNGEPYTVIGVMPKDFDFPDRDEVWVPLALSSEEWAERGGRYLNVIARLAPGVSEERALQEMNVIAARAAAQYPQANAGVGVGLRSLHDEMVGDLRRVLLTLFGAVSLVLLIACANVATLLLARITSRQHETAVRSALGASRAELIRQLLTEYVLLSLVSGACGLVLALFGIDFLLALRPGDITQISNVSIDGHVLGFGLLLSLLTGVIFGLVPALLASEQDPGALLRQRGEKGTVRSRRLQSLFVVGEVALALVLLIGAGLMSRSFQHLYSVDPGFDAQDVFTLSLALPDKSYPERAQQEAFFARLLPRIQAVSGVEVAAGAASVPMSNAGMFFEFSIEGRPPANPGEELAAAYNAVSADYFSVLRIPVQQGRGFTPRDNTDAPGVCVINESMARRYWPGENPIGQRVKIGDRGPNPREIVGIVRDVRRGGLDAEARPEMYVPFSQAAWSEMTLVVRSRRAPVALEADLRREVWAVDRNLPISKAVTMEQIIADTVSQRRFNTLLLGSFALVALILAAIGIYGIMWYTVRERSHEISVRMALGASLRDIRWLVLRQGLSLVGIGIAIGLPVAFSLTRVLAHSLYGVSATDPLTIASVCGVLLGVTLVACYLPVARASRINPQASMRGT
jgi:putative ABC transport system permease protein